MLYKHYRYLLELVKAAVNETAAIKPPLDVSWGKIYQLASETMFSCPVFYAVSTLPPNTVPRSIYEKLFVDFQKSVSQDAERAKFLNLMTDFCEEEKIDIMLLKGSCLREFYPQAEMRYMIDADILIHDCDSEKIDAFLIRRGFILRSPGEIHDEYVCKRTGIIVEIHKKLVSEENRAASFFNLDMTGRARPYSGYRFVKMLTVEDQYIYLIDHTAKHFYGSGITPRMILDFYVFYKKFAEEIDWEALSEKLVPLHYKTFERRLRALAQEWFSPEGAGVRKDAFSLYVLQNGCFGRNKNLYVSRAVRESKEDAPPSKFKYVLRRLFPSFKMLRGKFPILEKRPYLTPLMFFPWWATWFDTLFIKKKLDYKTLKHVNDIDRESTDNLRTLYEEMELDYRR